LRIFDSSALVLRESEVKRDSNYTPAKIASHLNAITAMHSLQRRLISQMKR
jgi:hypothetical protein